MYNYKNKNKNKNNKNKNKNNLFSLILKRLQDLRVCVVKYEVLKNKTKQNKTKQNKTKQNKKNQKSYPAGTTFTNCANKQTNKLTIN